MARCHIHDEQVGRYVYIVTHSFSPNGVVKDFCCYAVRQLVVACNRLIAEQSAVAVVIQPDRYASICAVST